MGLPLFAQPNYVKATYFVPQFGRGDWELTDPLSNLRSKYFINKAITVDALLASTQFEVDLGAMRDIKAFIVTNSNADKDCKIRVRASNTIAWSDVQIRGVNALGATSVNIKTTTLPANIQAGEYFHIDGSDVKYQVVTGTNLAAATDGSITIKRIGQSGTGLIAATLGDEDMICHSGNYDTGLIEEIEWEDYQKIIYGYTDPWGSPTIWFGKETEENRATLQLPNPYIKIFENVVLARYWLIEFDNTSNPDGFISIDDIFLASGYVPYGIAYGANFGVTSNTASEESSGGVEAFDEEKSGRYWDINLEGLPVEEAVINVFDMQRRLDKSQDFYFIPDMEDTKMMTRRSFVGRFENWGGQQFVGFEWVDNTMRIKEKLA